jgi:hypothetical protein
MISTFSREEGQELIRYATFACKTSNPSGKFDTILIDSLRSGMASDASLGAANEKIRHAVGQVNFSLFGPIGIFVESGWVQACVLAPETSVWIGSKAFSLRAISDQLPFLPHGSGHRFTPLGVEILNLIIAEPEPEYVEGIREGLLVAGVELVPA